MSFHSLRRSLTCEAVSYIWRAERFRSLWPIFQLVIGPGAPPSRRTVQLRSPAGFNIHYCAAFTVVDNNAIYTPLHCCRLSSLHSLLFLSSSLQPIRNTIVAPRHLLSTIISADPHAQPTPQTPPLPPILQNITPRSTRSQTVATWLRSTRSPSSFQP